MRCIHSTTVLATALLAALVSIASTPTSAASCADLKQLVLPETEITAAEPIPAATPTEPYIAPDKEAFTNLPAFCRPQRGMNRDIWPRPPLPRDGYLPNQGQLIADMPGPVALLG